MTKKAGLDVKANSQFAVAFRQFRRNRIAIVALAVLVVIVMACVFQNYLTPYDYAAQDVPNRFAPISWKHICGTDQFGRDLFTRILKGGQASMFVAFCAVMIAAVISAILGSTAAFFGGAYEMLVMRIVDIMMSIPALLMAAAISTALGSGVDKSIIAIAIAKIANLTRIMYSSALTVKSQEYLEAAYAVGASKMRMVLKYVIPNCMAPLIVQITLQLGITIALICSLSFIGLGVQPPTPEWGSILNAGRQYIRQYWPMVTFPGVAIAITTISVNLVGDGIRDALDPRLKR